MRGYRSEGGWEPSADRSGDDAPPSRLWALPALVLGGLTTLAVNEFTSTARSEAASICSAILFVVTLAIWKYRRERWFWPFILMTTVIEGLAIWLVPWPRDHKFEKSDLALVWLDFFLLVGALAIIDHFVKRKDGA